MNSFSALQLFVRVVEAGSFSAAARTLGMTPSNVSRQISQLEEDLGVRLFHRTTRKQNLSEAGEIYFAHANRIVADLEEARSAVGQLASAPSGRLNVSTTGDVGAALIAPILPEFLDLYPKIQLQLSISTSFVDLVEGRIDVAIRMGHLEDSSLVARRLTVSRSQLWASANYLARNGTPQHPSDLISHACLSFQSAEGQIRWSFEAEDGALNVPISVRMTANSLVMLRSLAVAGCGIIMIPTWMVGEELRRGKLLPVLEQFPIIPPSTPISAVFPHKRQLASKVRVFVDFLAQRMEEL